MTAPSDKKLWQWRQALAAVLLAGLPMYPPLLRGQGLDAVFWLTNLLLVGTLVGVFYLNLNVAAPRLLFKSQWGQYLLVVAGFVAVAILVDVFIAARPAPKKKGALPAVARPGHPMRVYGPRPGDGATILLLSVSLVLAGSTLQAQAERNRQEAERRRVAEHEKMEVELAYLRSQLNPHVFFNTLNSIYVLAALDVEQARQAIMQLSRLMRYLLYQTHEDRVPLRQEITFLQDYIALMKLRLTPNMAVEFHHPEHLPEGTLAPLLLQPFVENAFKHGLSTKVPATIFIRLHVLEETRQLQFEVHNHIFSPPPTAPTSDSGLGLATTRRRLDLLYPGRYTLQVRQLPETDEFIIHLSLPLV